MTVRHLSVSRMRLVRLAILVLLVPLTACSGPIFGGRNDTESGPSAVSRERTPPVDELLAINVETLETTSAGAEQLRLLSIAADRARESDRVRLLAHRAELLADLVVLSHAWGDINPERAEWYAAAAGLLVGVDAADVGFADAVVARVRSDASGGHLVDATEVNAEAAASVGLGEVPRSSRPRAVLLQLSTLSATLSSWSRYGDSCDGGQFSRAAVAYRPTAVSGEDLAGGALASDENLHAAQALVAVVGLCDDARAMDVPLLRAAEMVVDDIAGRARSAAVPLDTPTALLADDVRLTPPLAFGDAPAGAGRGLGFTFRRAILVRTDGLYAMVVPHVSVDESGAAMCPAVNAGWGFPGRELLAFEGFGTVPNSAVEDRALPAVSAQLEEMEGFLAEANWLPFEEARSLSEEGEPSAVGISIIADGDTYFSTLRPLMESLRLLNYSPIALHTMHAESGALDAVAVRLVAEPDEEDNVLIVREDGYVIQPFDPTHLVTPMAVSRVTPNALVALHNTLTESFADGTLNPERPLTVRVDDNSVDYAILAHMLTAVGFVRDMDGVTTDLELLQAPIITEDGIPGVLAPAGLRLSL